MTRSVLFLLIALLLAACAAKPTLEPRQGGNPEQVDLSGSWVLRAGSEVPVNNEQTIRIPRATATREAEGQRPSGTRRTKGSSVHLFLETGKVLKVSQTDFGLFFSFDRAVVEEYTFGEYRPVRVGPILAQRASGWDGSTFVVETMDEAGNLLTERWFLDGAMLVRDISISERGETPFFRRQEFAAR